MLKTDDIIDMHSTDVAKCRQLIMLLIRRLEESIINNETSNKKQGKLKNILGEKDNTVSSLSKLVGMLLKIIPIEQSIAASNNKINSNNSLKTPPSDSDKEIIERYMKSRT